MAKHPRRTQAEWLEDTRKRHAATIVQFDALVRADLARPWTLDELSRKVSYSRFHLTRIFAAQTGLTPMRYLSKLRFEEAAHLLATTSMNVAHVSSSVGFYSVGSFSSAFTRHFGMTASEYREIAQRGEA